MTSITRRLSIMPVLAAGIALGIGAASARILANPPDRPQFGLFNQIFGGDHADAPAQQRVAQAPGSDVVVRIDRLESQIRQLTGVIEQLQYHNQQLEAQVRRMQEDDEYRFQELGSKGGSSRPTAGAPVSRPLSGAAPPVASSPVGSGRRNDAFDPTLNPNAPGSPRAIGSLPPGVPSAPIRENMNDVPPAGVPGAHTAGEPLDLSTAAANGGPMTPPGTIPAPGAELPAPPYRNSSSTGVQVATAPPADTPKDQFDLAYGYIQRRDFAMAEDGFRTFLQKYPNDVRAADAQYWLGESLFQRQRFRDAAESFLAVSNKYDGNSKAPDALLRLGQSLAALGERDMACATFGEVGRKYPRAPTGLKQGVEREQKRVHC